MTSVELGAYGLSLPGLPGAQWLLEAPAEWPSWSWAHEERPADVTEAAFSADAVRVCIPFEPGASLLVDRAAQRFTYVARDAPRDVAWVHPLLSPAAIFASEWAGRLVFHSGSFLDSAGRVWGLLGHRERGKSTALAWLAAHGHRVFADDLLVTDGLRAYAGPRCIDLRHSAASEFGIGKPLGRLGSRARWRVDLPAVPAEAPLGGFIALEWGGDGAAEDRVVALAGSDRVTRLSEARALLIAQAHQFAWLNLLPLPMYRFTRPQSWSHQDASMQALLEVVDRS